MRKKYNNDTIKKELINALIKRRGIISAACQDVGVSRNTYYTYYNEDPEFRAACDEAGETAIDFVEGQLYKLIEEGDKVATIFYMKTRGKKRGYNESLDLTSNGQTIIPQIEVKIITEKPDGADHSED